MHSQSYNYLSKANLSVRRPCRESWWLHLSRHVSWREFAIVKVCRGKICWGWEGWGGGFIFRHKRIEEGDELTRFLGFTSERILFMDSPSDLPSKSIYNREHLKTTETGLLSLVTAKMNEKRRKELYLKEENMLSLLLLTAKKSVITLKIREKCMNYKNFSPRSGKQSMHLTIRSHLRLSCLFSTTHFVGTFASSP